MKVEASCSGLYQAALPSTLHNCHPPSFANLRTSVQRTSSSGVSSSSQVSASLSRRLAPRRKGADRHLQYHTRKQQLPALHVQPVGVISQGEVADVEEVEGIRLLTDDDQKRPIVQYLIKWKDGSPHTWEPAENLAENLKRDFETMWWTACREGDAAKLRKLLGTSGRVLSSVVDENRRSGLHFVAAVGNAACTKLFCEAGADINLCDKDGYTPLHMAVGYSHVATVAALLEAGADPEVQDRQSRDVVALVGSIRDKMPLAPQFMGRRMALEQVAALLADNLFEEVEPAAVLDTRANENGTRDFLVKWPDGAEDSWVTQWDVAADIVEDYDAGLEYCDAQCILKSVQRGDEREYLVRWADDYPDSWEPEDRLPQQLVAAWEEQQRERLLSSMHSVSGNGRSSQHAGTGRSQEHREHNGAGGAAQRNGVAAHAGEESMQGSAVGV